MKKILGYLREGGLELFLVLLLSFAISSGSRGEIMTATALNEVRSVLSELPPQSLIFLDVDDTLITPCSRLFHQKSPYRMLIDDFKENFKDHPKFEEILSTWRLQRKIRLVSQEWPSLITELRSQHLVYALTKMDTGKVGKIPSMEEWRYEELTRLGFLFTPTFEGKKEKIMVCDPRSDLSPAVFYKGIFITGSHTKGQVLEAFSEDFSFPQVVLIDDRIEHLEDVERVCLEKKIPFLGILFKGMDLILGSPDPQVAEFQKAHLFEKGQWLEDEEALQRLRTSLHQGS